jgi:hypothetical protein
MWLSVKRPRPGRTARPAAKGGQELAARDRHDAERERRRAQRQRQVPSRGRQRERPRLISPRPSNEHAALAVASLGSPFSALAAGAGGDARRWCAEAPRRYGNRDSKASSGSRLHLLHPWQRFAARCGRGVAIAVAERDSSRSQLRATQEEVNSPRPTCSSQPSRWPP